MNEMTLIVKPTYKIREISQQAGSKCLVYLKCFICKSYAYICGYIYIHRHTEYLLIKITHLVNQPWFKYYAQVKVLAISMIFSSPLVKMPASVR